MSIKSVVIRVDGDRRGQFQRGKDWIENVAAKIAQRPTSKILPVTPLEWVIDVCGIIAHRCDADPSIPIQ